MKHFLSTRAIERDDAISLLDTTMDMAELRRSNTKGNATLAGKTVANVFFEDSTRTRLSFEIAARALGADVVTFTAAGSSASKGESLKDTLQTLEAMGSDHIVLRHGDSGVAETVVEQGWVSSHVINAGDGTHEHPTQALLDAYTIRTRINGTNTRGGDLSSAKVVIVGDVLHSRVARSNLWLLRTLGANVSVAAPITLQPAALLADAGVTAFSTLDDALDTEPNVVMCLRVQRERMSGGFFPTETEYARFWGMSESRLERLSSDAIVMHPGPMNRGVEIASSVADSARSVVAEQVTNGVAARMAVLSQLTRGGK